MQLFKFLSRKSAQAQKPREILLESLEDRTLFDAAPVMHFLASQPLQNSDPMAPCQDCGGESFVEVLATGPDLFVTKTNGESTIFPGDELTYTITYINDGVADATGVVITENLPDGTTFDPTNSSSGWLETAPGSGVFEFEHGTLPGFSEFFEIFFAVTVDGPNVDAGLDSIINTVSIADDGLNGPDDNPANNAETEIDTLVAAPNLSISKTDGGISASAGDTVVYTLSYLNIGNQGASGVFLTETLPENTTFNASQSTAGWTETSVGSGVYELFIGTMAAGDVGVAEFAIDIDSPLPSGTSQILNVAMIADDGRNGFDPPTNNTASDETPITSVFSFDIAVEKSDGDATTVVGGFVSYDVTWSNLGQADASGVVVTENLPAGTTFDAINSDPGWIETSPGSGIYEYTVGNLPVGSMGTAVFAVIVDNPLAAGIENIANLVTIADDGSNGTDDNAGNNAFVEETPVDASPNLFVNKDNAVSVVNSGDGVSYTINYGNTGDQGSSGVEITETLPAGTTFDPVNSDAGWMETTPGVYVFQAGTLASGDVGSVVFAVTVNDPIAASIDQLINNVFISDDGLSGIDADELDNSFVEVDDIVAAPDLRVTKDDGLTLLNAGEFTIYTITYSNVGNQGATNVVLTETLPTGTSFNAAGSTVGWTETAPGSGIYELMLGTVAAGTIDESVMFAVTVDNPIAAGIDQLTNTVTISDDGDNGADLDPTDNSATDVNDVFAVPNLGLVKSDGGVSTAPAGTIIYTLTYSNTGTQGASGVVITETLPANTTFNAASSTAGWTETSPGSGVYELAVGIVPGATVGSVDFAVDGDGTLDNGDIISNTAMITDDGSNGVDPDASNNTASDDTPVVSAVDLVLTKDDGGITTLPGGIVVYTLSYENAGTRDATGVFITETVPVGSVFDPGNSDVGWVETTPGVWVYTIGDVPSGDSGTVSFAVTVSDPVAAGIDGLQNTAVIEDDDLNGDESNDLNNTGTDVTPIDAAPDLFVTKDDSRVMVDAGQSLVYSIGYGNAGSQDATGVVLTETLPAGTSFDAANSDMGWVETVAGSGVYELAVGDLAVGDSRTVDFAVLVDSPIDATIAQIVNSVVISDDGTNGLDENESDNEAIDTNDIGNALGFVDLAILKDNSVVAASGGDEVVYVIEFANNGTALATGVVLTETLPPGATFNVAGSSAGWYESPVGSGTYLYNVGDLAVGATGSVTFAVTVDDAISAGIDDLANSVEISSNETDDDSSDNIATDIDSLLAAPDLYVTKDDSQTTFVAGESIEYTIIYGNDGSQDATGVIITEELPAGTTFDAAASDIGWVETAAGSGIYEYSVGNLAAGSVGNVLTFAVIVDDPLASGQTTVQNIVSIGDDGLNGGDEDGFDNTDSDSDDLWVPPVGDYVELSIEKTDFLNSVSVGDVVIYQLSYANNGNVDATNVVITDVIPVGSQFDLNSTFGWVETAAGSGVYEFPLGTLAPGESGVIELAVFTDGAAAGIEQLVNTATISDDGSNGADARPDNNQDVDTDQFVAGIDLYVVKDDFQTTFTDGESIDYTITYGNTGDQDASGVVITESLPAGATFDAANSDAGWVETAAGSRVYEFHAGNVPAGSTGNVVVFAVTVDDPLDASVVNLFNTVTIEDDGTSGLDENADDNLDSDSDSLYVAPVNDHVDLAINKTDNTSIVSDGDSLVYAIEYSNDGTLDATGVVITETLPDGASFDAANSESGWTETAPGSGVYEFNAGTLAAGESRTIAFAVVVDAPLDASIAQLVNSVSIADDGANGADARPDNNSDSDVNTAEHDVPPEEEFSVDLYVAKDDFQVTFVAGETLVYTIVYGNNGDADASGVVLTESLPSGAVFLSLIHI